MAITATTAGSSNAVQALYQAQYIMAVRKALTYSQSPFVFVPPQGVMGVGNRGSAVNLPMFHELDFASSLSETSDITPVLFYENNATITPELYGNAVQLSQKLSLTAFTDVERAAVDAIGRNAGATREQIARKAAIGGTNVLFGGDATSRATVSTASTTDVITYDNFVRAALLLESAGAPMLPGAGAGFNGYAAVISAPTEADLVGSSAVLIAAEYGTNQWLLNGEIGSHLTGTRLVRSPWAKIYRGAGASGAGASGKLDAAVVPGGSTFATTVALGSFAIGDYAVIGAVESTGSATDDVAATEVVRIIAGTTNTSGPFTIIGAGVNGGFMYAHSTAAAVQTGMQDVHATVFLGGESIGMVYSNEDGLGPEGQIFLPEQTGILHQFNNIGWSGFWGFGRVSENRVVRVEAASNYRALGH